MGTLTNIGIEKIRVYPTSQWFDLSELVEARDLDPDYLQNELMVHSRGINPLWEDAATMAVNAAMPMLTQEDRDSIGLLIVGTETGLDQEKALSSWVLRYLGLPSTCRHFEIKCACYSGTAAIKMATGWLSSGMARPGQKALVITTDQSLNMMDLPWEFIGGAASVAMLISDKPDFVRFETEKYGICAQEISDVIRPIPWIETGDGPQSLFSYMDSLIQAYDDYMEQCGEIDFDEFFQYNVYHVPFSGISFRAHKQLLRLHTSFDDEAVLESFRQKTKPALAFTSKVGGSYGGSIFIGLLSIIQNAAGVKAEDRVGIFSYGAGSCAEFYSVIIGPKAKELAQSAGLDKLLAARQQISRENYETLEIQRTESMQQADFTPDLGFPAGLYQQHYEGKGKLIYKGSKGFFRTYGFS